MPGYLLASTAKVICAHGGAAQPSSVAARVTVMGQPLRVQPAPEVVSGCPHTTPAGVPQPCVTASWLSAATRITVLGQPVLLADSKAMAVETGAPASVIPGQNRVQGI
ncbi:Hypothetical protein A7982_11709 [Minicystis rosea]|nr:Hypothetical protein A7982_11709 [Minicystis rosea]